MKYNVAAVGRSLDVVDPAQVNRGGMNMPRVIGARRMYVGPADLTNGGPALDVPFQKVCDLAGDAKDRSEQISDRRVFTHLPLTLPHLAAGAFAALRASLSF